MIRKTKGRMAWCCLLLCCNLLFIWGNSLLRAEISGALSQWVRDLLGIAMSEDASGQSDGVLRKIAHFGEFCTLGILLSWLFAMLKEKKWAFVLPAAACGCLAACTDELLQHFAPGRAPRLTDVGIDTAGVLAGIGLLCLGYYMKKEKITTYIGGK